MFLVQIFLLSICCTCTQASIWSQQWPTQGHFPPTGHKTGVMESCTDMPPKVLHLQSRQEVCQLSAPWICVVHCTTDSTGTDFMAGKGVMWTCGFGATIGGSKMNWSPSCLVWLHLVLLMCPQSIWNQASLFSRRHKSKTTSSPDQALFGC